MSRSICTQTSHKTYIRLTKGLGRDENDKIVGMDTYVLQKLSNTALAVFGLVLVKALEAIAVHIGYSVYVEDFEMLLLNPIILFTLRKSIHHEANDSGARRHLEARRRTRTKWGEGFRFEMLSMPERISHSRSATN